MRKLGLPAWSLIALALVAGFAAGGLAVYVKARLAGNNGAEVAEAPGVEADAQCTLATERGKAVTAQATGEVAAMMAADTPQSLAGLVFDGPDGQPMTLGDLRDKVLLVNLWATWCAPCRAEMPALDALQAKMGGDEFEVVAVNVDTGGDEKPKKFLAETGGKNLAYYRDETLELFNDLKRRGLALGLPVTLLVDRGGCLLAHMNGPAEWQSEDAARLIEAALAPAG